MDIGMWRRSRDKRYTFHLCLLTCFCLLARELQYATASEDHYSSLLGNQGLSGKAADSKNKLDSLNSLLSFDSEDSESKRSSSFFPLRGKKFSFDQEGLVPHHPFMSQEDDKRSQFFPLRGKKIPDELKRASYFMPMRGRKDETGDYDITDESPDKRASSFMPMRGKKESSGPMDMFQHLGKTGTYSNAVYPSDSHGSEITGKRSSSFMPMRGKRSNQPDDKNGTSLDANSSHPVSKRSVSFMPMRGRRELEQSSDDSEGLNTFSSGEIATSVVDKKQYAFMPMRGRREIYSTTSNDSYSEDMKDGLETLSADKKAALFMPMRGRRVNDQDTVDELDSSDKRAQYFMPMRGRRTHLSDEDPELFEIKRASSFMPMRGRRTSTEIDSSEWTGEDSDPSKRASAFTAMRGRRLSEEQDPSMLYPEEPESKRVAFMPMRGRKAYSDVEDDEDWKVQEWPAEQFMSLLDKKSAFMPMRGRRFDGEANELDLEKKASSFMPMRGRREETVMRDSSSYYNPYPYFLAGIGSSLISRPYGDKSISFSPIRSAANKKRKFKINWDSVKRAFHATRGKRLGEVDDFVSSMKDNFHLGAQSAGVSHTEQEKNSRVKRSIPDFMHSRMPLQPQRQYIALKRPMSFFATRGKRLDDSAIDKISKLR